MSLTALDWIIVAAYFLLSLAIGLYYFDRAGQSVGEFFLSGRNLPWWLAGTSMVATTFAADTPLAVAGIVARDGVAGNWIWWNAAIGGMLTVFFFARLWRRAGIMTDVEFAELRYSGRPAAILRGFRALYLAIPINCAIMGWVNLAMAKVLLVMLGWDRMTAVFISLAVTGAYVAVSGLWGVVVTDAFQFVLAMIATTAVAWFALQQPAVGGIEGLRAQLPESAFRFLPVVGEDSGSAGLSMALPIATFITFIGVQWWASWLPRRRTGRWRLRRPAHDVCEGRASFAAGHAMVHRRALLRATMAVDPGRSRLRHPLSRRVRSRSKLCDGDSGSPAPRLARVVARRVLRRGTCPQSRRS